MTRRGLVLAGTVQAPWQLAEPWGARGYLSDLHGLVHWVEFGAQTAGPPLVFVHGLGGSHLNWTLIGAQLAAERRAVAPDLRGFGLSAGSRHSATIAANLAMLDEFSTEVVGRPAILVGNSMGGMLSILQAHARPDSVAGVVLIAPALPTQMGRPDLRVAGQFLTYAVPGLGEAYLRALHGRHSERELVNRVIALCFADPARADPGMVEATVALAELRSTAPGRDQAMLAAARSLLKVAGQAGRYRAAMASIRVPVLLIGGELDRLVPVQSVRAAAARNPGWQTVIMPGVGHTPQLEQPQAVVSIVHRWLDEYFPRSGEEE